MNFSKNDLYPNISEQLTTTEQTIPETAENDLYKSQVAESPEGMSAVAPVNQIWATILGITILIILLGFIE